MDFCLIFYTNLCGLDIDFILTMCYNIVNLLLKIYETAVTEVSVCLKI